MSDVYFWNYVLIDKLNPFVMFKYIYMSISWIKPGHRTYAASFYKKQLTLNHLIATYKKPMVSWLSLKPYIHSSTSHNILVTIWVVLFQSWWIQVSLINGVDGRRGRNIHAHEVQGCHWKNCMHMLFSPRIRLEHQT